MASLATLIADPAFRDLVIVGVIDRATAGGSGGDNTASRNRLDRRLRDSRDRLVDQAERMLVDVANASAIRTPWESSSTFPTQGTVSTAVETQLVAIAAAAAVDYTALVAGMTNTATVDALVAALAQSVVAFFFDVGTTPGQRTWIKTMAGTFDLMRAFANDIAPFALAHDNLIVYSGDLSGVAIADIAAVTTNILNAWIAGVA